MKRNTRQTCLHVAYTFLLVIAIAAPQYTIADTIFGYTKAGANVVGVTSSQTSRGNATSTYTASAGEVFKNFSVYAGCAADTQGDGWGVEVGLYTFSGGVPVTLLATTTMTGHNTSMAWATSTDVNIALTAGVTYAIAIGRYTLGTVANCDAGSIQLAYDVLSAGQMSQHAAGALPTTWSQTATSPNLYSLYGTVTTATSSPPTPDPATTTAQTLSTYSPFITIWVWLLTYLISLFATLLVLSFLVRLIASPLKLFWGVITNLF